MTKDTWKNNIGLKIMAVLFSVFLWWTVVNIDDPVKIGYFEAEISVKNASLVTSNGKSYQIDDDMKSVRVAVKARRKVLDEMKASDIVATVDLLEMDPTTGVVPIRVEVKGFDYVEATASPRNIQIVIEETRKNTFPIQVATTGNVQEGYILDKENTTAVPKTIDISGPKSSVLRISRVVAKVDVSELSQDTMLKAEVIYYDSADNIVDQNLTSNCDKNGVVVDVKLLKTKEVEVKFDSSEIVPEQGYVFKNLEFEPQKIHVAGTGEALANLNYIMIPAEALHQEKITSNIDLSVDISDYLPEGIQLVNEEAGTIAVRILLEEAGTKSIMLPVRSVKVNGASDLFEMAYGPEQEVELKFSGPNEILENLTAEKIIAIIDVTAYKEEGTYEIPVQIIEAPDECIYVGEAIVQITFTKIDTTE